MLMPFVYIYRSGDTNSFKIGKAVDLARRKKALVTGNPEPLTEFDVIETAHAAQVETYLHHRLRSRRVLKSEGNEWFQLDADELSDVIRDARHYAEQVLPMLADADLLAEAECEDRILEPTPEDWDLYLDLLRARERYETLEYDVKLLEARLKLAIGTASGMERVASWRSVITPRFDSTAFAVAHPELHHQFVRESRSRRFNLL
jgi:hypothetical protein